ncbi:hypothetical protein E2C01_084041 [Portunus trituberculatus]|uniref:Uncharacterized protein n=1 Tax=Portunus trituberculatus TaxID=210409 RepID=A0A5B7J847_PORTR|nr:hypothetical protein [Portunus trituberculatus]
MALENCPSEKKRRFLIRERDQLNDLLDTRSLCRPCYTTRLFAPRHPASSPASQSHASSHHASPRRVLYPFNSPFDPALIRHATAPTFFVPLLSLRRCRVRSCPTVHNCPGSNCACAEPNVYKDLSIKEKLFISDHDSMPYSQTK